MFFTRRLPAFPRPKVVESAVKKVKTMPEQEVSDAEVEAFYSVLERGWGKKPCDDGVKFEDVRSGIASAYAERWRPRPLAGWHEDDGPVLWWKFPVNEPPYVGTPLDGSWPGYHTHFTPLPPPPKD